MDELEAARYELDRALVALGEDCFGPKLARVTRAIGREREVYDALLEPADDD